MTNTGHLLTGRWSVLISAYTLCKLILRRASTLSISQIVSVILNTDIQEWHLQRIYLIPTWYAAHTTCKYAFHTSKLFMYRITSTGIFQECFLKNWLQLLSYRKWHQGLWITAPRSNRPHYHLVDATTHIETIFYGTVSLCDSDHEIWFNTPAALHADRVINSAAKYGAFQHTKFQSSRVQVPVKSWVQLS